MFPHFDAAPEAFSRNDRKPARRTSGSKHEAQAQKGLHGRHETQRRRYAADCDEAKAEIRNALRAY